MNHRLALDRWTTTFLAALAGSLGLPACGDPTTAEDTPPANSANADSDVLTPNPFPCERPRPRRIDNVDTGFDLCANGMLRRRMVVACPVLPHQAPLSCGQGDSCLQDSDCTLGSLGICTLEAGSEGCACRYGCVTDADCGDGRICLCETPVGRCVSATCTSDDACPDDLLCASYKAGTVCGPFGFSCQRTDDACASNLDCRDQSERHCYPGSDSRRQCQADTCGDIGRPFLIHGHERLASPAARADWLAPDLAPASPADLGPAARAALVERWTRIGLMEHASVAAFARFALQLMALGAPPALLAATQRAMSDETHHARLAFALASAFKGASVGPGPLAIEGALDASDLLTIAATTIREGCIGETIAALEAAELALHAEDPAVRAALERIARDEQEHARLAWATLRWLLDARPQLHDALRHEFALALHEAEVERTWAASPADDDDDDADADADALLAWGVPSDALRAGLAREALARVIRPAADALLAPAALAIRA